MEQNFNHVLLCGQVLTQPQPSHVNHGQSFSRFLLSVPRLSGQEDCLPVIVPLPLILAPSTLLEGIDIAEGTPLRVTGQLRSFNNRSGQGPRLVVSVFAQTLQPGGEGPVNRIRLSGVLCKPPTLRCTPLGREICDIILAVNRRYGRADYLPLIAWGTVARQTSILAVGARLTVEGRIQSRTYTKNLETGPQERVAYEVSVMRPAELSEFVE